MDKMEGFHEHVCAPKSLRSNQDITGSPELDAEIARNPNRVMPARLAMYLTHTDAYGPRSAYNGYRGYSGDE